MKEGTRDEAIQHEEQAKEHQKQPYSTPQLTVHGTVENLTRAIAGGSTDGVLGSLIP